ncbi:MAG: xanthine dehydrogenase family protein subunit M, partial [Bradyrhizobiaceae bacterium]
MNRYDYVRPDTIADAIKALSNPEARALAGGTNLVDLMKSDVARPAVVVDINRLPLKAIEVSEDSLRVGALVSNSDLAWHPDVQARWPLLSSAILAGASPQLRNAATTGGNLLQRTRCYYFYDPSTACNKRAPGSGCSAIGGVNRIHAILGASSDCIAVHPSDMCVALAALDATVEVDGPQGQRELAFTDFHRLPDNEPERDNNLQQGDLITAVTVPAPQFGKHFTYLKLRDRLSYAFALVSVAAGLQIENGTIKDARIALGGVAHKPWRDT